MATRVFTSTTTQGMVNAQRTNSALTRGQGPASYFDPLTGQLIEAETPQQVLQAMDAQGVVVMDKDNVLRPAIEHGELAGNLLPGSGRQFPERPAQEWDVLSVDLTGQPDIERAKEIILDVLRHPDVKLSKNPGNGKKVQEIEFNGQRAVLAWATHTDQEAGPHFQVYVHNYAIRDDKSVTNKITFKDSWARAGMEEQFTKALTGAGLHPIAISLGASPDNAEAREAGLKAEHNDEFQQAAAKGEVPPLMEGEDLPQMDAASETDLVRRALKHFEQEAAKNWAKAQADQQRAHTLGKALQAITAEKELRQRVDALEHDVKTLAQEREAQAQAAAAALEAIKAEATREAERAQELAGKLSETGTQLAEVNQTLMAREQDLESAESMIEDLDAQAKQAAERADALAAEREALAVRVAEEEGNARTAQARAEEEAAQRAQDAQAHAEALAQAQTAAASAQGQVKELGQELDASRAQVRTLAGERDAFKAQAEDADRARQRVETQRAQELREHTEARATLEQERDAARKQWSETVKDKNRLRGEVESLRAELEARPSEKDLAQAKAEARREAEAKAQAEAERQAMAEQLATMRQQLAQAQAEAGQVKAELAQRPSVEDVARITAQRDQAQALIVQYRALVDERKPEGPSNDDEPGNKGPGGRGPGAR